MIAATSVARSRPAILAVVGGAWLLALAAELSDAGRALHHGEVLTGQLPMLVTLALFLVAWQAHVAAMMLPSSLPLTALFGRVVAAQSD